MSSFKERFGDWPNSPQGKSYGMEGKTLGEVESENTEAEGFRKSALIHNSFPSIGIEKKAAEGSQSAFPSKED